MAFGDLPLEIRMSGIHTLSFSTGLLAAVAHPFNWGVDLFLFLRDLMCAFLHDSCAFHPLGDLLLFVGA